jgi:probable phosphoglycerate mutase
MTSGNRLYIFRHGETDWNSARRIQGHTDIPLNAVGRVQAYGLAERVKAYPIEAILSSDLVRARETAEIVAARLAVPLFLDPRLREASLGEAEGLTVDEVVARYGLEAWQTWCSYEPRDWSFRFPNGEAKRQTLDRAAAVLAEFLENHAFTNVAVSTHGGVIRTLVRSCMGAEAGAVPIQNCGVHVMDRYASAGGIAWTYVRLDEPEGRSPEF